MGQITVRQLDDSLIHALRQRAAAQGHIMEEEVRRILAESVSIDPLSVAERLRRRQASYAGRRISDSGDLVRQMRDERSEHLADRQ